MTLRAKVELIIAAIALVVLGLGAKEYLAEHDARIKAEAVQSAQAQVQAQYAQQFTALQKQMADRDSVYRAQFDTLTKTFQAATTPDQVARLVGEKMKLSQPIVISTPPATPQDLHPAPIAQIAAVDFPQAKAYIQDCEICKADRAKLQADAADREQQAQLAQKQVDSLKTEVVTWQKAAKGGTVLQRVGRAAKYLVIGAAVGYVAARH